MKKYLLITLFILGSIQAFSQIEKGSLLLGGSGNFQFNTKHDDSQILVNPNLSYFVSDNITIGASIPIYTDFDSFWWDFSPSARYYFNPKSDKSIFLTTAISVANIIDAKNAIFNRPLKIGVGHVWFLNKSIGIETELNWGTDFEEHEFNLLFGFQIYLNNEE